MSLEGIALCCSNCHRALLTAGYPAGHFLFCSPMCRDTSDELRKYEQAKADETRIKLGPRKVCAQCGALTDFPLAMGNANFCSSECVIANEKDAKCSTPNCEVCSGAIRERAKGDRS